MDNAYDHLKSSLLHLRLDAPGEEAFLEAIEKLAQTNGPEVYSVGLDVLAGVNLLPEEAARHWRQFHNHRNTLARTLARNVDVATALCDYLHHEGNLLEHPRIIETLRYESVFYNTVHDRLTTIFNRPYFDEIFTQQLAQAKRYSDNLTLLFIDIDNFKDVNDTYGHPCGDEVLRKVARLLNTQKRDSDIVARYGGEEFVLMMTRTDAENGCIVGERLRSKIEQQKISYQGQEISVTISGGIASFPLHAMTTEELLNKADRALYQAKGSGKNKILPFTAEKRRYLRVEFKQDILAKELNFRNSKTHSCQSKDICVGGMLFENQRPFPLGALLTVRVDLDDGPPVLLIGNVVRVSERGSHKFDIGMTTSFQTMDKIAHKRIADLLHHSGPM